MTSRANQRLAWARQALADPTLNLESASSDASFRSYWRTLGRTPSLIVMDAPPGQEDLGPWLQIVDRLCSAGLHAPKVFARDLEQGFLLLADLGHDLLLPALDEHSVDHLYGLGLDTLLAMQIRVDSTGLPRYDEPRLVAEMELMPTWFLQRHLGYTPECEEWDVIASAFRALVSNAQAQPQVFVHRDFHSRNLLLDDDALGIIDFQDAVRGPITYDLASLLRDCYIAWPPVRVHEWVEDYRQRLIDTGMANADAATFRRWFDLMGLQRHIKVLGIFCRLWYRDGKAGYLNDLPLVWQYTRDVGREYASTRPLVDLIERALADSDIRHPRP
jgi:N-acetylmuramate 1-kinase